MPNKSVLAFFASFFTFFTIWFILIPRPISSSLAALALLFFLRFLHYYLTKHQKKGLPDNPQYIYLALISSLLAKFPSNYPEQKRRQRIEKILIHLGLTRHKRRYILNAVQLATEDPTNTLESISAKLVSFHQGADSRVMAYDILWRYAISEGNLTKETDKILQDLIPLLKLKKTDYDHLRRKYLSIHTHKTTQNQTPPPRKPTATERKYNYALNIICGLREDSFETLRHKYHDIALKYHPDLLYSQNVPEELIKVMTRNMTEINTAWATIKHLYPKINENNEK